MTERKMPSNDEIRNEIRNITVYPSGKENIGKEPVKGEQVLSQDKSSKLEKGLRIAGGAAAFVALCSLMQDPEYVAEHGPSLINEMIGTPGELLVLAGGSIIAGGKAAQEVVVELIKEGGDRMKKAFVSSVANAREEGNKIGSRIQSFTKKAIEAVKGTKTEEFSIYRAKANGEDGVELDTKIVTTTNKRKNETIEATYKKDDKGGMKLSSMIFDKIQKGGKNG